VGQARVAQLLGAFEQVLAGSPESIQPSAAAAK